MNRPSPAPRVSRREFLRYGALAASTIVAPPVLRAAKGPPSPLFTGVGITAQLERAAVLKACGADFIVESVARFLVPDRPDPEFEPWRERAMRSPLPVLGCNSFLRDPRPRCTGPNADHPRVLAFAETAFRRLRAVGGEYIVFGSNTARQLPPGWAKGKADEQFVSLLQAMGPLAARHGITVAVEAQRASECNYLNHLPEVVAVVSAANQPAIRVLADFFHLARMGDTSADLARAMPWVGVVELAENANRTLPGVAGDDFRPLFAVLAAAGYSGRMDIEADGTPEQIRNAFATIARQVAEMGQVRR
ncbi:MAG TPA: TIM barrel protein [Lacunisphaera sp.]|nr:TIM barrel protein [Lacunisphaera sp.]